jgi:flagellin
MLPAGATAARDDGGAFAVAQKVRGDIAGVTSANEQLGAAKGLLDTTLSGLNRISDTMASVRGVLVKLADENVSGALRSSYLEQFMLLRTQIANFQNDSSYNEVSLLGKSGIANNGTAVAGTSVNVVRNERGESLTIEGVALVTVGPDDVSPFDRVDGTEAGSDFALIDPADTADAAAAWREYLTGFQADGVTPSTARKLADVEAAVNLQLNKYGNAEKSVINQIGFNKDKIDALESGLGALIDADLAKESARLQSLQIRQQLGATALSAANTAPQFLLSLFR